MCDKAKKNETSISRKTFLKDSGRAVAFARSGNPNNPKIPNWPAYTSTTRATMSFDDECRVENDPDRAERHL
jgi:para-nitrobenzyl esterase